MNRLDFLCNSATASVGICLQAGLQAIEPIQRNGTPRLKLSLAAYSFRKQLTAKPGTPGAMDMLGFIDWAATQDLDAVEPTSYFFPLRTAVAPGTRGQAAQLKAQPQTGPDMKVKERYVFLECTVCKHRNYTTHKRLKAAYKLEKKKYCNYCRAHTSHREKKL